MLRLLCSLLLLFGAVASVPARQGTQPPGGPLASPSAAQPVDARPSAVEPIPVIRLSASTKPANTRALKYQLLPDPLDLTPGNAALVWIRAGRSASATKPKMTEQQSKWTSATDVPLDKLPKEEVRAFLAKYATTLRLADDAARKNHCDWEIPPLTLQNMATLSLDEVQACREIANLLSLQCRLELSEGKFDQALHTLQTGFALARHAGQGDMLIQNLIGIAIAHVMLARVEEMIQMPEAPNLYWALTTLPSPFVDMRTTINTELNMIYRSYPALRKLDGVEATPTEFEKSVTDLYQQLTRAEGLLGSTSSGLETKLGLTAIVLKTYPDAKHWLIAQGLKEDKVAAMPALQVVLYYQLDQYNQVRDDIVAAVSLPPWQARSALDMVEKKVWNDRWEGVLNPFLMFLPAIAKVYEADLRRQRNVATLRTVEALRGYAGAHDGKVPEKLADVTDVPSVIDPQTGKGYDGFYQVKDGTAVLEVLPLRHLPVSLGRRYELKAAR